MGYEIVSEGITDMIMLLNIELIEFYCDTRAFHLTNSLSFRVLDLGIIH